MSADRMTAGRNMESFKDRLDALGPDFARWPGGLAEAAADLVANSSEARAAHAEAKRLAGLVAEAARAETPNGFAFRVVADVAARRSDRLGWLLGSPARLGLVGVGLCAAALAIGITMGSVAAPAQADSQDLDFGAAFGLSIADGDL